MKVQDETKIVLESLNFEICQHKNYTQIDYRTFIMSIKF